MKFKDYEYQRPDYEITKEKFIKYIDSIECAADFQTLIKELEVFIKERNTVETMGTLCSIRYSIDTTDKFYNEEREYWDNYGPLYEELNDKFYKVIIKSKYRKELEEKLGTQFFKLVELKLRSFSPEIIEELQQENKVSSEYDKLIASAKIPFDGEERNLSGMGKYTQSIDKKVREAASKAMWKFFEDNEKQFDRIYDDLVKIRTRIAKKLGFSNYVELGYIRMSRTDYNAEMVSKFREQVREYIVPVASKLYERQRQRLNLEKLNYYDLNIEFLSGNATPKGDGKWILENGLKMYSELSTETKEFFNFMAQRELLDLETKKGKSAGGYCTYINDYKSPFIFSNFNGTSGDVDVLTHEAGHAFQVYSSRWISMPEVIWPTCESCEIHSMSMEFFTWPWMSLFFKEDTDKYKFTHLGGAMKFIPYGVTVDEFQHFVYENPEATSDERKKAWREIERKYLPHKDYSENEFLDRGTFWYKQGHIFGMPFYYIDYTLAQLCALQFWKKMHENREMAWSDYLTLCKVGGTKSFLELVELANLKSPFKEGCISSIIGDIDKWLENVDDKKL